VDRRRAAFGTVWLFLLFSCSKLRAVFAARSLTRERESSRHSSSGFDHNPAGYDRPPCGVAVNETRPFLSRKPRQLGHFPAYGSGDFNSDAAVIQEDYCYFHECMERPPAVAPAAGEHRNLTMTNHPPFPHLPRPHHVAPGRIPYTRPTHIPTGRSRTPRFTPPASASRPARWRSRRGSAPARHRPEAAPEESARMPIRLPGR
jgi:hypothetical protein